MTQEMTEIVERYKDELRDFDKSVALLNQETGHNSTEVHRLMLNRSNGRVFVDSYDARNYTGVLYDSEAILSVASSGRGSKFDAESLRTRCAWEVANWYCEDVGSEKPKIILAHT